MHKQLSVYSRHTAVLILYLAPSISLSSHGLHDVPFDHGKGARIEPKLTKEASLLPHTDPVAFGLRSGHSSKMAAKIASRFDASTMTG